MEHVCLQHCTTLQGFQDLTTQVTRETGIQLQPVGTAFVMKETNDQIIPQQLASLVTVYGVMGYARIDLSIITGIMSGLTVGVGIDYAIHYVSLLKQARRRGDATPSETALNYVATPVLANVLGLAIGFTTMPSHRCRSMCRCLF